MLTVHRSDFRAPKHLFSRSISDSIHSILKIILWSDSLSQRAEKIMYSYLMFAHLFL